jgi:hypothetical protein
MCRVKFSRRLLGSPHPAGYQRLYIILRWLVGSTYLTTPQTALIAAGTAAMMTGGCFLAI